MKKIKKFLTKFPTSTKTFLLTIPYVKILMLIITTSISILTIYNILLITFEAKSYFDIVKYSTAIISLFALDYLKDK